MATDLSRKIICNNIGYNLLKPIVLLFFGLSYRKREVVGVERIPKQGAVIFAPNHTNALMDALAILDLGRGPKVFVARADIFKRPFVAKLLTFLKIMPINRKRDGLQTLKDNDKIFQHSTEVLKHHVPFCILPEGTHRAMHSLLPLGKGVFRIALRTCEDLGDSLPVYIVPVGIEYGNFFRSRSSILVQVGNPINVSAFVQANPQMDQAVVMNHLKDQLAEAIKNLILYIPDDDHYEAQWELCNLSCQQRLKEQGLNPRKLSNRLRVNRQTVAHLQAALQAAPSGPIHQLLDAAQDFAQTRKEKHISMSSVSNPNPIGCLIARIFTLIALFPLFAVAAPLSAPVTLVSWLLCRNAKDEAFHNSLRYGVFFLLWLLSIPIMVILFFALIPWEWAIIWLIVGAVALCLSPILYYDYYRWCRITLSDIKWLSNKNLHKLKDKCTSLLTSLR